MTHVSLLLATVAERRVAPTPGSTAGVAGRDADVLERGAGAAERVAGAPERDEGVVDRSAVDGESPRKRETVAPGTPLHPRV